MVLPKRKQTFVVELSQIKYSFNLYKSLKHDYYHVSIDINDSTGVMSGHYESTYDGILESCLPDDFKNYFRKIVKNIAFT